ncbi:glycosyltransferase family 4 protein [Halomonas organivorans]|uniref:Glycosyltransferase involved in cell wall biosynthesis n=1 Tax=Halomonas organivorans TaxID=257772 RepID=A0A7W5BVS0_9GAMM|nr:glycosyltransferase family 4 protein [Halomonas organivorans]MBB3140052.1 glycosyltransferase involved in cell wall biosynthesis [Halomonas organivorans]
MKRFLMIASFPDSLISFRGRLLEDLQSSGWEVHVASPDVGLDSRIRTSLEAKGIVVHAIPMQRTGLNPFADFRTVASLYRLMQWIAPDMVLGYTIKPVIYGTLTAWLAKVPKRYVMITGLGYAFTSLDEPGGKCRRPWLSWLVKKLYGWSLARSHRVFFQNNDDLTLLRELEVLSPRTPYQVVNGSGIDIDEYAVTPPPRDSVRFLLIARLLGNKGVREYVQAARLVKRRYPHVVFSLVGWLDDNPDSISRQELDRWIDAGDIEFLGRLEDVRSAIAECSVYVLPSYREGTPRTVLEAMAMGRAVITSDAPGCRETVVDGDNGFLVPVRDVMSLADTMLRYIHDPDLVGAHGERSRWKAVEKYDVNKVNEALMTGMGIPHVMRTSSNTMYRDFVLGSQATRSQ